MLSSSSSSSSSSTDNPQTFLARLALSFLLRISRLLRVTSRNSKFSSPQLSIFLSAISFFLLDFSFSPFGNLNSLERRRRCFAMIQTSRVSLSHRWFAVSLKRVLEVRGGGGAAVAMVEGDDAGNDIYKQLGA